MINIDVKVNGGLFEKDVNDAVREALHEEALQKLADRIMRGGKGLGARKNTVTQHDTAPLEVTMRSTLVWPRTTGFAWRHKNIGIARSMVPRVLRKAADRVVTELN